MRDTLPRVIHHKKCGIVNFTRSHEPGSHWVCYFKDGEGDHLEILKGRNINYDPIT